VDKNNPITVPHQPNNHVEFMLHQRC